MVSPLSIEEMEIAHQTARIPQPHEAKSRTIGMRRYVPTMLTAAGR